MERVVCGHCKIPLPVVTLTLGALLALFVWVDAFDRLVSFVQAYQFWEIEEILALLLVLGLVCPLAFFFTVGEPRNKRMVSRDDLIKDIVGKDKTVAVFVVEIDGLEHEVVERATTLLEDLVGEDRLTSFRIR